MKKVVAEIRGMDSAELRNNLAELRREQFELRFHAAAEQVAKTSRHNEIRRSIARIMTILCERERSEAGQAAARSSGGTQ